MAKIKRIIIGQSGGPTPVIDWEVAGMLAAAKKYNYEVYGAINGLEGILHADVPGNIVDLTKTDPTQFIYNGPGAGLKTTRIKPAKEQYQKMAENLKKLGVDGIIYIGGNDSADQLKGLTDESDIRAIHAIKTVDNDLPVTHHCPGFGSAALYNATALKNVHNDFSSYRVKGRFKDGKIGVLNAPVIVYQVMGRKAGWLAQATAFARVDPMGQMDPDRAPHIILSKEVLFDKDKYLGELSDTITRFGEAVVVVQEDLTDAKAKKSIAEVYGEPDLDPHGNIQHGRATSFAPGVFLAQLAVKELKVEAVAQVKEAVLVPQHIQRSHSTSLPDASEAYMIGYNSVEAMASGVTRTSVIIKKEANGRFCAGLTDLANIARKERSVDYHMINDMNGPTQEFIDEFLPCIGGPIALPQYSKMVFTPVDFK
jgi:ATP-dependent phosphofructokinase / diphosphate-dependent phosphofructokinase